jgi:hypothetical protein
MYSDRYRSAALTALLGASAAACAASPVEIEATPPHRPARPVQVAGALAPYRCDGVEITAERTFCVHDRPLSWADAEQACVERGGHLATFLSAEEGQSVASALSPPAGLQGTFWFGLAEPREHMWLWVSSDVPTFGRWAPGEPNNSGGEDCAEWITATGLWNDLACDRPLPYVCERLPPDTPGGAAPPMSCTGTQVIRGQKEYCFFTSNPLSWLDAHHTCIGAGGRLAMPRTPEENDDLRSAVAPRVTGARVWIGATDASTEGTWLSPSGKPVPATAWGSGEPNNMGDEDCAEMAVGTGAWNDLPCREQHPFVCEKPE